MEQSSSEEFHVYYEAFMCFKAAKEVNSFVSNGNWYEHDYVGDLLFEAFLLHFRCLYRFLRGLEEIKLGGREITHPFPRFILTEGTDMELETALDCHLIQLSKLREENNQAHRKMRKEHVMQYWALIRENLKNIFSGARVSPAGVHFNWDFLQNEN